LGLEDDVASRKANLAREAKWKEEFRRIGSPRHIVMWPTGVVAEAVAELIPLVPRHMWWNTKVVSLDNVDYLLAAPKGDQRAFFISAGRHSGDDSWGRAEPGYVLYDGRIATQERHPIYFSEERVRTTFLSALADADWLAELRDAPKIRQRREERAVTRWVLVVGAGLVGLWLLYQAVT